MGCVAAPAASFLDVILRWDLGNFLDGIFFLIFENFRDRDIRHKRRPPIVQSRKMARRLRSGEPGSHAETQWEGIMCEEPLSVPISVAFVNRLLRQHERQDLRNVLCVAGAVLTVIADCRVDEPGNLPRDDLPIAPAVFTF